jgi:hypothetical protein
MKNIIIAAIGIAGLGAALVGNAAPCDSNGGGYFHQTVNRMLCMIGSEPCHPTGDPDYWNENPCTVWCCYDGVQIITCTQSFIETGNCCDLNQNPNPYYSPQPNACPPID